MLDPAISAAHDLVAGQLVSTEILIAGTARVLLSYPPSCAQYDSSSPYQPWTILTYLNDAFVKRLQQ